MAALISAGSGALGAFLGAAGAVIGPWWLKKTDHKKEVHEARRKSIVDFSVKKIAQVTAYNQAFHFGGNGEDFIRANDAFNISVTDLYSRISSRDSYVKQWINEMSFKLFTIVPKDINDVATMQAFIGIAVQELIAWHSGEKTASDLTPFGLDKKGNKVNLKTWQDHWPE